MTKKKARTAETQTELPSPVPGEAPPIPEPPIEPPANEHPTDAPPPEHAQQAVDLPLDRIRPPMLIRELGDLIELSGSIKVRGVLQAITVRPRPDPDGSEAYETVIGWRRVNACRLVGRKTIPAVVRELSDGEALEICVDENINRKDFGPLEEAEAFARFLRLPGYTIPRIAERFAKSAPHVAQRIQLMKLSERGKKALAKEWITLQVAILIARLPNHTEQDQVLANVAGDDKGRAPEPVDRVREVIEQNFLLRLDRAPWKLDDAELVPAAGSCTGCPKQTGAQGMLFPDVKKSLCTDRECWRKKLDARWTQREHEAKNTGEKLLAGKKALTALAGGSEFTRLDGEFWSPKLGEMVKVKKLLGKNLPPLTIAQHPETREHVQLVPTVDVERAIKEQADDGARAAGETNEPEPTNPATNESYAAALAEAEARKKQDRVTEQAIRLAAIGAPSMDPVVLFNILAKWALIASHTAALKELAINRQVSGKGAELPANLEAWLDAMPDPQRIGVAIELALRISGDKAEPGRIFREWVFDVLGIDLAKIEKSIEQQDAAAAREAEHPGARASGRGSRTRAAQP